MLLGHAFALVGMGCSEPVRGPFFGDDKLLRFGVDPYAEAAEVQASFERAGHSLVTRQAGQHFTALSFRGPDGRPSAVRVVTRRGIAVALDGRPASAIAAESRYTLLPKPIGDTYDADGDGFDELFLAHALGGQTCILVYRVRDVGFVDPIDVATDWLGADACVEKLADRDRDGRVELLATWTIDDLPLALAARVPVAWVPERHDYVLSSDPAYYADEVAVVELELVEAQGRGSAQVVYGAAVRLAALLALSGFDAEAQVARVRWAFEALPIAVRDPDQERALLARVEAGLLPERPAESRESSPSASETPSDAGVPGNPRAAAGP